MATAATSRTLGGGWLSGRGGGSSFGRGIWDGNYWCNSRSSRSGRSDAGRAKVVVDPGNNLSVDGGDNPVCPFLLLVLVLGNRAFLLVKVSMGLAMAVTAGMDVG